MEFLVTFIVVAVLLVSLELGKRLLMFLCERGKEDKAEHNK